MDAGSCSARSAAVERLSTDAFENLMTLKMLTMFPSECQTTLWTNSTGWACRTELGARVSAWDKFNYPHAKTIIIIDGTSDSLMRHAIESSDSDHAVFKVHHPRCNAVLTTALNFKRVNTFLSFTLSTSSRKRGTTQPSWIERHAAFNPEASRAFSSSGYTEDEFRSHLERGAQWFAARIDRKIASFCLAYPNHGQVWEVGAVLTDASYRRRGLAKAVVSAALSYVLDHGLVPRYQFHESNTASRALAQSIGLTHALTVDHFAHDVGDGNALPS